MIKKITCMSILCLCAMVTYKNSAMVSRALDSAKSAVSRRVQTVQRRQAALPSHVARAWTRFKYAIGLAPKGRSPEEQVTAYANDPIIYMRNARTIPPTLLGQEKIGRPILRAEKLIMPPFAIGLKVLATLALWTGQPLVAVAAMGVSKISLGILSTKVPRAQDPFSFLRTKIKQGWYRSVLTSEQRLRVAFENISSGDMYNARPDEFPVDIINEPLLENHTLLQKLLLNPGAADDSAVILFLIGYGGAHPQKCESFTMHPVTIVLQRAQPSPATLLALVNPYITNDIEPLPTDVEAKLKVYVAQEREKVLSTLQKLVDPEGQLTIDSAEKKDFANQLILLNQINEGIGLLKTMRVPTQAEKTTTPEL
jgi:hypothetical protein